ncbi:MAG: OsmC family protein [Candidatus Latescibacteria bacterium]|nr:OsmC family protein [Candidatus Latescibacterota bacterium]
MVKINPKVFTYKVKSRWIADKIVLLEAEGKPSLEVATPPDFGGPEGVWSPEDLFVSSVNICILTTFLFFAQRQNVKFLSYQTEAEGTVEMVEGVLMFTRVIVRPIIEVEDQQTAAAIQQTLEKAEKYCLISSSVKTQVTVEPQVLIR